MRSIILLLVFLLMYSCKENQRNEKYSKTYISYLPLNSIYLFEERDSIRNAYSEQIRPIDNDTDCIISLPSVFHKNQEFIPVGYLYFNKNNELVKAEVIFTLGNNPNIDTTGIRSELMKRFGSNKNAHHSYYYGNNSTFKSFIYQTKAEL